MIDWRLELVNMLTLNAIDYRYSLQRLCSTTRLRITFSSLGPDLELEFLALLLALLHKLWRQR